MDIVLSQIKKRFGDLQAVKTLSLSIKQGEFVSLLGPSGCGKTTLLRMLAGLETPDGGEIRFGDTIVFSKTKKILVQPQKRNIGMVFQDFALWPHMTVFENVAYSLRAKKQKKLLNEKVMEALRSVQLENLSERYPHQLSGGQQQRVSFARAIVNQPDIILLDEPLSALDAALREEMRLLLQKLVKQLGITAIYVTHDQSEAMAMSDRIVVMSKGEVIQVDTPEMIYHDPVNETVARFVGKGTILTGTLCTQYGQPGIKIGKDMFIAAKQARAAPLGNEIQLVIRPEMVEVSLRKIDHEIIGKVETISYLGERYEGTVRIERTEIVLHFYTMKRIDIGLMVHVKINSNEIHVLPSKGGAYETA